MKKAFLFLFLLTMAFCSLFILSGCGAPPPAPEPTPVPTPEPTPFAEPVLDAAGEVTFNGCELPSGSFTKDGIQFVKLSEAAEALGSELLHEQDSEDFSFAWRKSEVKLRAFSDKAEYLGSSRHLDAEPILCDNADNLYVPLQSLCSAAEIGFLYDAEFDHTYCTPATGGWELAEGYNVPVFMYHCVAGAAPDANLVVDPSSLEQQLQYITENGYTTIWFEDLWHVEDFEKPVILTFDDGYTDNYINMLPLMEKYNCKATVFIITRCTRDEPALHMSKGQIEEMDASGLISIQSHTVDHEYLTDFSPEGQEQQMADSRLFITRLLGKEPLALAYPTGKSNDTTVELLHQYYRFGIKMFRQFNGDDNTYNTSEDSALVYRHFVERQTPLESFARWLDTPRILE